MALSKATVKPTAKVQAKVEEVKKAETKPVEVKAEQMKLDVTAEPKKSVEKEAETKKTEVTKAVEEKKETVVKKATTVKKTAAAKKATTAKKTTVKKTAEKKEAVKASVHVQCNGNSYEIEDLIKITKDIWKYDFKKKANEFKSVDIYVKLEDKKAYYVINGEITGSFGLN